MSADRERPVSRGGTPLREPLLVAVGATTTLALLHWHDPHGSGVYGYCPSLLITGIPCPGCGGLRAVNLLTNGDVGAAMSSNALAVVFVVALAALWLRWTIRRARGRRAPLITLTTTHAWLILAAALAFGVFRLTPWGSWFLP